MTRGVRSGNVVTWSLCSILWIGLLPAGAGNPSYLPDVGETDLDGAARLVGTAVDLGADEFPAAALFRDGFEGGNAAAWSQSVP